jgi:hypothetical protein
MLKKVFGNAVAFTFIFPQMLLGKEIYLWRPKNQIDELIKAVEENKNGDNKKLNSAIQDLGLKISSPFMIERLGKDYQETLEKVTKTFEDVVENKKDQPEVLKTTLEAIGYFSSREFHGEEKEYGFIDENILKVQQKIIASTDDSEVLKEMAYSLSSLATGGKKIEAGGEEYDEFFSRVSTTQKDLLFSGKVDIHAASRGFEYPLENQHVANALGEKYPEYVTSTIDALEDLRLKFSDRRVKNKIFENITSLMASEPAVSLINEDDLIRHELLSLKVDNAELKRNLKVIKWFLEGKSDTTRKAFADQIEEEIGLHKQYSFNATQVQARQDNEERIQKLAEAHEGLGYKFK